MWYNNNKIKSLNSFLVDKSDPGSNDSLPRGENESNEKERSIYDIEEKIIEEFKLRVKKQNTKIDELGNLISELKIHAKEIGEQIKGSNITIKKIIPKAVVIIDNVEKKKDYVTDLVKKLRNKYNICCDIILFLILLGLICFLLSIIRHKYF